MKIYGILFIVLKKMEIILSSCMGVHRLGYRNIGRFNYRLFCLYLSENVI
jgi:hypothetical protein